MGNKKVKQLNEFAMEGNGGGDTLYLKELNDNNVYLEIGHCCVRKRIALPVEVVTSVLFEWLLLNSDDIEAGISASWEGSKKKWIEELIERYRVINNK